VNQHWDAWALLSYYPTGGAVPCPRMKVWVPEDPPGPHPSAKHGQQFDICFPSLHQVPIDVTAGTNWGTHTHTHKA